MSEENKPEAWERELISKVSLAAITEQRRARRWGIFFKFAFLAYLVALLVVMTPGEDGLKGMPSSHHTALVDLDGVIATDEAANADNIVTGLREAFENKGTKGVILRLNSPGGSPVQAAYVYDEIRRLRKKYPDIPLYAVVSDICASACYYIASAADRIYANKNSLVGSIGVLMNGFGYVGLMEKLGIERRLLTAGEHKGILDPFSPAREDEVAFVKKLLDEMHQQFIAAVKQGRGDRLKDDPDLFSGLFWTGTRGKQLGLVDDFASASTVAREVIGEEKIVDFTPEGDLFDRLADRFGSAAARTLVPAPGSLR